ncbi:Isatin hydrolase [Geodia barretti]|uniref:Isatin hydrolase n=1 Tax=Geodia barretti TaxID=519541 RepID=A0AA35SQL4_GEOBA|nr:Isatin hydrolase [Geodia barretti]
MQQRISYTGGVEKIVAQPQQEGPEQFGAFNRFRTVDLSHHLSPHAPHWPGDPPTEFKPWSEFERDGYYLRRFSMSEHGGTHLTAPASYYPDGRTVEQYTAAELFKPAVVIDVRDRCRSDQDYALTVEALAQWESRHGKIPPDSLVLLHSGWHQHWNDPDAYLGTDADGTLHFPGFGLDAATLLISERGVAGLGTDTAGVEPGIDSSLAVSRLVLSRPRIVLENLANLHQLPPVGAWVLIGALKLAGGSGSPAAVTALLATAKT